MTKTTFWIIMVDKTKQQKILQKLVDRAGEIAKIRSLD